MITFIHNANYYLLSLMLKCNSFVCFLIFLEDEVRSYFPLSKRPVPVPVPVRFLVLGSNDYGTHLLCCSTDLLDSRSTYCLYTGVFFGNRKV
jgi:hypothetical protein